MIVPFNKPWMTGKELDYIREAHAAGHLSGDGMFSKRCEAWLEEQIGAGKALLTHSCTAALEMSAILAGVEAGDEVIMPSFTFVSTANAFVLRGAVPVFADIRPDTLNLDETRIEAAVTDKTRAIVAVHYAGVGCEMDVIGDIARRHGLQVIEDAAQGIQASYRGEPLGGIGGLAALSFHETKNIISGEGGALLINDPELVRRAEIVREKGTNRSEFFRGQVDKYTWMDVGSSFLPSDLLAAFLWAQMEEARAITARRLLIWRRYHELLEPLELEGALKRPFVPEHCAHNAHMYYILLRDLDTRTRLIEALAAEDIGAVFHYVPLHSSPYGQRAGRAAGDLHVTDDISDRLLRLPLWLGMESEQDRICEVVGNTLL
jgi:dTDP-4-amino-4,6-dideoxygalactose transaminase